MNFTLMIATASLGEVMFYHVDKCYYEVQHFLLTSRVPQNADDRQKLTKAYQDAWTINSLRFFANKAISCAYIVSDLQLCINLGQ